MPASLISEADKWALIREVLQSKHRPHLGVLKAAQITNIVRERFNLEYSQATHWVRTVLKKHLLRIDPEAYVSQRTKPNSRSRISQPKPTYGIASSNSSSVPPATINTTVIQPSSEQNVQQIVTTAAKTKSAQIDEFLRGRGCSVATPHTLITTPLMYYESFFDPNPVQQSSAGHIHPVQRGTKQNSITMIGGKKGSCKIEFADGGVYEGGIEDGKAHGKGKYTYDNGSVYDGQWKEDKYNGQGKLIDEDGDAYEGQWKDGMTHGTGTMTYSDGDKYEGDWKDDKMDGNGKYTWSGGRVYEGEWNNGEKHGKGKEIQVGENGDDIDEYVGEFKNGKRDGKGKCTWSNGDVYEGQFKNNKRNGTGTFTWSNGDVYEGQWESDGMHGKGKMTYVNGDVYEGEWENENQQGKGKMTYANGDVYNGDWANDKRQGSGTITHTDKSVYDGDWEEDKKHGTGMLKEANGVMYKQVYSKGEQVGDNKRCGRLMYGPPSQRPRTNETSDITILNDDYKVCFLCRDDFSTDINSTDDGIKNHLPVLSTCWDHFYCLGCIMKMQMARAEANRGRVPKKIACPGCRKKGAFCPSEPKYHKLLIKLLEDRFPVIVEHSE